MKHQRGGAILMAMLVVTLVATLCMVTVQQQWRSIEVESAERSSVQARWLLRAAADWVRLILSEDARNNDVDHLGEPWTVNLQQAPISSLLGSHIQGIYLSGRIEDLQARLNVSNLVQNDQIHAPTLLAFSRLFEALHLSELELRLLTDQLLRLKTASNTRANSTAISTAITSWPLTPSSTEQLAWLGLSADAITRLQPYVVVLPEYTPVNLNTASALVLHASIVGLDISQANRVVQLRMQNHFKSLEDVVQAIEQPSLRLNDSMYSLSSSYFASHMRITINSIHRQEVNIMRREGLLVKSLWTASESSLDVVTE